MSISARLRLVTKGQSKVLEQKSKKSKMSNKNLKKINKLMNQIKRKK